MTGQSGRRQLFAAWRSPPRSVVVAPAGRRAPHRRSAAGMSASICDLGRTPSGSGARQICAPRIFAERANFGMVGCMGLRERKKSETRAALSWAAVRLIVERGGENVLVEDIAAAAGVSPRTFSNYFSGKGEAVAARH